MSHIRHPYLYSIGYLPVSSGVFKNNGCCRITSKMYALVILCFIYELNQQVGVLRKGVYWLLLLFIHSFWEVYFIFFEIDDFGSQIAFG